MRSRVFSFGVLLAGLASFGVIRDAAATDAQNYAELEKAVLDGKDIRMTLDLSKCLVHSTEKPGPLVRGSLHFEGYMEGDQGIAFATTHFTVRSDNTPVDEFLSFKVDRAGKVDAKTRFLNPVTYAVFHEAEFDCSMGEGVAFHW
ncbi:MAG: VirK family protein [Methylocella sp.]